MLTQVGRPWRVELAIFRIGDRPRPGQMEARLPLRAVRRVQLEIDCELRQAGRELTIRA